MIYVCGPGHGGPGMVANAYLEGTYSEFYPNVSQDAEGLRKLFTQFSFPGGIPHRSYVRRSSEGWNHATEDWMRRIQPGLLDTAGYSCQR